MIFLAFRVGCVAFRNMDRDAKAVKFEGTSVALQAEGTEANFTS